MLLPFSQFEREVTAERIRDKIAASKQKGVWMGGLPPLGKPLVRGALYPMLQNRLYRGLGLAFDDVGERLVPSHANKRGIRYRYYVSQPLIKRGRAAANAIRCPAGRQPATLNAQRLSLDIRLPHIWPAQLAILTSS